eukprot:2230927-Ditylum_brightwellii.AAC.1
MAVLKFNPTTLAYLTQKKIFINIDHFDSKKVASPGCIIKIHPQITRKVDLQNEITSSLQTFKASNNHIIHNWQQKQIKEGNNPNKNDFNRDSDNEDSINNIIPKFTLCTSIRKWGNGQGCVETT